MPETIGSLLISSFAHHSERDALHVQAQPLSYRDLFTQASQIAAAITSVSKLSSNLCATFVDKTETGYAAVLAAMISNSVYMPLNPRYPTERNLLMMNLSRARILIVDESSISRAAPLLTSLSSLTLIIPDFDKPPSMLCGSRHDIICRTDFPKAREFTPLKNESDAYLLFTSGTTGAPKGVLVSQSNLISYVNAQRMYMKAGPSDIFSNLSAFTFDLSLHDMLLAWLSGGKLCPTPSSPLMLSTFINTYQITRWLSVPSTASLMAKSGMLRPGAFPSLRESSFCGESLPTDLAAEWQASAPQSSVINLYGPTEATIAITRFQFSSRPCSDRTVPIGVPFPGQEVMVADQGGVRIPDGVTGELWLSGSQVVRSYWNDNLQLAASFRNETTPSETKTWYRTGDRGYRDDKGVLHFVGRTDRQVKIRGFRVELNEIDNHLRVFSKTGQATVLSINSGRTGMLIAFVSHPTKTCAEIVAELTRQLPDYMIPTRIHILPAWPLTENGKTDYKTLKKIATEGNRI